MGFCQELLERQDGVPHLIMFSAFASVGGVNTTLSAFVSVCGVNTTLHRVRAAFFQHLMVCSATQKVFDEVKQMAQAQSEFESAHAVMEEVKDKTSQFSSKLLREGQGVEFETLAKEAREISDRSIVLTTMQRAKCCVVDLVSC